VFLNIALTYCSAQLMLLQSDRQSGQGVLKDRFDSISPNLVTLSTYIIDIANKFDISRDSKDMAAVSPFMAHCLYQASIIQARLFQETNDINNKVGLLSLQRMLLQYNERWRIAGMLIFQSRMLSCLSHNTDLHLREVLPDD
jgi:hypothetical protein